ncbi:unnamed protein product [Spirodela intermedia]|uniref:Uncharacterized protein n=1 Tax=Spirodela intermedia TaxID=51605 RepID=A0A7I8IR75_SPIIN|nr:unnamed protein product [Spirodela intermedia]CAA6660303.1 unnamed protein product [Spirodela intermedia]
MEFDDGLLLLFRELPMLEVGAEVVRPPEPTALPESAPSPQLSLSPALPPLPMERLHRSL